jgi:hypothetical protein
MTTMLGDPSPLAIAVGDIPAATNSWPYWGIPGDIFGVFLNHVVTAVALGFNVGLQFTRIKI